MRTCSTSSGVLAGDNEKQVAQMVMDMLDNERDGKPTNFLALFYLGASGGKTGDTGAGHRAVARIKEHMAAGRRLCGAGTLHAEDLSNDAVFLNGRNVAQYVQSCRDQLKAVA
jgi:hypothetical protein